jgi:hypothetical protein
MPDADSCKDGVMSGTESLEAMFAESGWESRPPKRRRGRGWKIAAVVVGVIVVLAVVGAAIVDNVLRSAAESVAAGEVQTELVDHDPGHVSVKIGGFSVIQQYLKGTFERVDVTIPSVTVNSLPVSVHLVAHQVSTDLTAPIPEITGSVSIDQAVLNKAFPMQGVTPPVTLGHGTLSFNGSQAVAGGSVAYTMTVTPSIIGGVLELTPKSAVITSAPAGVDKTAAAAALTAVGSRRGGVCVASLAPTGAAVTGATITPKAVVLAFTAKDLTLSSGLLSATNPCV